MQVVLMDSSKIHRESVGCSQKKVRHQAVGTDYRFQPSQHLALRRMLRPIFSDRLRSEAGQQQIYPFNK